MKLPIHIASLLLSASLLTACASVKTTSGGEVMAEPGSPVDTIFVEHSPALPETEYKVFRASVDGKAGWMNVEGEWIVPPEYDHEFARGWYEGINICRKSGMYGAVNYKNETVIPFEYPHPPANCSDGLILVIDSLREQAYFTKDGVQITDFKKSQPPFINGLAIVRSDRQEWARYPRIDLENTDRTTRIHRGDLAVINTQFDTLLQFENVPFLLEFGTLNNNRRTFFLYPFIGLHADLGISYGRYGYLNGEGHIAIEPKFRASDVFIRVRGGVVRDANCPFNFNLSAVRELDEYYFIDTLGNTVFQLPSNNEEISDVSYFNDFGIAGYRTFSMSAEERNRSKIHLIDSTGKIVFESYESDASLSYVTGNVGHQPFNGLIPIYDMKNGFHRIYTPDFKPFATFPLRDSSGSIRYQYRGLYGIDLDDPFILTQFRSTKNTSGYPGSHQRLVDKNGVPRSSWFSHRSILSSTYGNFTWVDTATQTSTLYDFNKIALFKCDSCFFDYFDDMRFSGVYKVVLSTGNQAYVNYKGEVLSAYFDSMEEKIIDIARQVEAYNETEPVTINAGEGEFEALFEQSIMYERIRK